MAKSLKTKIIERLNKMVERPLELPCTYCETDFDSDGCVDCFDGTNFNKQSIVPGQVNSDYIQWIKPMLKA